MRVLFGLSLGLLWAQTAKVSFFEGSWEALLQEARKRNRPIFVDFYAVWCGPCKMMDKYTFSNPEVIAYVDQNYIAYKVDAEKGEGPALANKFRIRGYPTTVFLDAQGTELGRQVGYVDAQQFLALLRKYKANLKDKKTEAAPSWPSFQEGYRVFFADLLLRAWGNAGAEVFGEWRTAVERGEAERMASLSQRFPAPGPEVLRALAQWEAGQKEAALHTLHHRLYQGHQLNPTQALWLSAYAVMYWEQPPPEALQWASFAVKRDPSGAAYLTQAALSYRLGRSAEARSSLKEAARDLSPTDQALQTLKALVELPR